MLLTVLSMIFGNVAMISLCAFFSMSYKDMAFHPGIPFSLYPEEEQPKVSDLLNFMDEGMKEDGPMGVNSSPILIWKNLATAEKAASR